MLLFRSKGDQTSSLSIWIIVTTFPEAGTILGGESGHRLRRGRCEAPGDQEVQMSNSSWVCRSGAGQGDLSWRRECTIISTQRYEGPESEWSHPATAETAKTVKEKRSKTDLWRPTSGGQAGEERRDAPCHPLTSKKKSRFCFAISFWTSLRNLWFWPLF